MHIKIGHRGAMGWVEENTLPSFQKAIALKVDMIEFDVHLCQTGEAVVMHDDTLERTTDGIGALIGTPLSRIRALKTKHGHRVPTLEDALKTIDRRARVNIELKGPGIAQAVAETMTVFIKDHGWQYRDFLVSSFDLEPLKALKKTHPQCPIGYLTEAMPKDIAPLKELDLESINIQYYGLDADNIKECHWHGWKVYVWTVNDTSDIKLVQALGVDGIFSDYPDRL